MTEAKPMFLLHGCTDEEGNDNGLTVLRVPLVGNSCYIVDIILTTFINTENNLLKRDNIVDLKMIFQK